MVVTASPWTFVRLKLRLTANGLRGHGWRTALFVIGALMGVFWSFAGFVLLALPGLLHELRVATIMLPLFGAALVLGWLFLPLVFFGVDESLDPARFALLPLTRRTLIPGLFAAALTGMPAITVLLLSLGSVFSAAELGGVGAAAAQLVGVVAGLLLCVAVSRSVTSAFATALRSRRSRDVATIALTLVAGLLGPLQLAAAAGAEHADWDRVAAVANVVAWTPPGAAYSLGVDVAAGRAWTVPLKLLIVLAAIAALVWWWASSLERAMLGGATAAAGRPARGTARAAVDRLLVRGLPRSRFGALMSRELRYWWRETRRRASLLTLSVIGVFLPVMLAASGGGTGTVVFVGTMAALSLANQFGFEGTAYAANIVAGVPGRTEVLSRSAAFSVFVVPLLVVISVVVAVTGGEPADVAGRLGTMLAAYGVGLAVVMPMSVRTAYALPDSTNPFAMSNGAGFTKGLQTLGALAVAAIAVVPLLVVSYLAADTWRWAGLPIGLLYGGAAFYAGARLAGDLLDRRMPEVLAAVTPNR